MTHPLPSRMHLRTFVLALGVVCTGLVYAVGAGVDDRLVMEAWAGAQFEFLGPVGDRVRSNLDQWLLCAPEANPGMLAMFKLRDRQPVPQLVPWAGEFVGKYLISAVQALRMTEDPRLFSRVREVVQALISLQSDDGYLGPFPKDIRLLKNWDLWGHYHLITALLMWQTQVGDPAALAAARKAADLVCRTYLGTGRRVIDAGDPEMNMSILTALANLHRITGELRYLQLAREIERDWEHAGDYLRAGLDGREFFQSPRPRWESLPDLQGLVELWRITGNPQYRDAFEHHWRSIRRWDRRNTGGFSSGEQATGDPFAPTAIETCCTVAWMALTIDQLRLTGDARAADDLELATLNGGLGAQHPSGRWWTYNTPMDGTREASAHTIAFQARAGTPELNCCSVNGPRIPGMLSEWAIMSDPAGLVLNWLGAGRYRGRLPSGDAVALESSHDAWREGHTSIRVTTASTKPFALKVRIPAWAQGSQVALNGNLLPGDIGPGYLTFVRSWSAPDVLELNFKLPLTAMAGAHETTGLVSLYRGPLLLAFDPLLNPVDADQIAPVDLDHLNNARVVPPETKPLIIDRLLSPWLMVNVPTINGQFLRLVDFASAGSQGSHYRSWLPSRPILPAPAFTQLPADAGRVPVGDVRFKWQVDRNSQVISYRLEFATNDVFRPVVFTTNSTQRQLTLDTRKLLAVAFGGADSAQKTPRTRFFWRVRSLSGTTESLADGPAAWFEVDAAAPAQVLPPEVKLGPQCELIVHSLRGGSLPTYGTLTSAPEISRDGDGARLNGREQMLRYAGNEFLAAQIQEFGFFARALSAEEIQPSASR
jgi:uncharacterized protein